MSRSVQLAELLNRGDRVAVQKGHLLIQPNSGKPIPEWWIRQHGTALLAEISRHCHVPAYQYYGFSTGSFGGGRFPGVKIEFERLDSGEFFYAIFNAELTRQRTGKNGEPAGSALPGKQFRITKKHALYKLWKEIGLETPPRLSGWHDYMGRMKHVVITGDCGSKNKLSNASLRLLEVPPEQILATHNALPHPAQNPTGGRLSSDFTQSSFTNKDVQQIERNRRFQVDRSTCPRWRDISRQESAEERSKPVADIIDDPRSWTNEQWLDDYCGK